MVYTVEKIGIFQEQSFLFDPCTEHDPCIWGNIDLDRIRQTMGSDLGRLDRFIVAHVAAGVDVLFRIDHLGIGSGQRYTDPIVVVGDILHVQNDQKTVILIISNIAVDRLRIIVRIDPLK